MRLTDIGHQLKAFRLESGLKADEIAQRLGISRAALYRYEKGEVIKLDTVQRLAELLKVSPLSLLGIGVEYYQRQPAFFERVRQIEETTDTILEIGGDGSYLGTSDDYHGAIADAMRRYVEIHADADPGLSILCDSTLASLEERRRNYEQRQPTIIALLSVDAMERMLNPALAHDLQVDSALERRCRDAAVAEVERLANLLDAPPMGFQVGLLRQGDNTGTFRIMRQRDRSMLAVNPFRPNPSLLRQTGIAIVTGAAEAVAAHQRVAEQLWKTSIKGAEGAAILRRLVAAQTMEHARA